MALYNLYPAVDENYNFPPPVRGAFGQSLELATAIKAQVPAEVAKQIGSSTAPADAAAAAVNQALANISPTLMYDKQTLPTGTDLNTLVGASKNGFYSLNSTYSYTNRIGTWAGRLEVRSTINNTTEHIITRFLSEEAYRRVALNTTGTSWSAWEPIHQKAYFRGAISDTQNIDLMQSATWNGAWLITIPQLSTLLGKLPPLTQQSTLYITSQHGWQVEHRIVEGRTNNVYIRNLTNPTGPIWTEWAKFTGISSAPAKPASIAITRDWLHLGDSLTDDVVLGTNQWGHVMGTLDGAQHEVRGWYNQEAFEIASRMGAMLYPVKVSGESIPNSSFNVTVTGQRPDQLVMGGYAAMMARQVPGWLNGRHGYLMNPNNSGSMVFRADDAESTAATPAPGIAYFQGDLDKYLGRIVTIWVGTNDILEETPMQLTRIVRSMLAKIPHARAMVFLLIERAQYRTQTKAINEAYTAAFPDLVFDPSAALRTAQAAVDAGISYTEQDEIDLAAGIVPASFRSDTIHLNQYGARALAYAVHREAIARGLTVV